MRHRVLALVTVALIALLGAMAGTASASAPTAPLTAVQNADGTSSLQWDLKGTSDSINILPHLRCAADPLATGTFAGAKIPCIWLVDHKAPLSAAPPGCPSTGQDYASWRCDMRLYRDVTVNAAETGESSLIMFNTKPDGGSGICAWIPIALKLGGGEGTVQASDGCPERIICAAGYRGRVNADKLDTVVGCRNTSTSDVSAPVGGTDTGSGAGSGSSGPGSGAPAGGVDLAKCTGARSGKKGQSPLYSVETKKRGRRGMYVRVYMRRAVPITVEVRVRQNGGSRITRWVPRCAKRGQNWFTLKDATGGISSRRNYQVVVRSVNSTYPLRSSYETLPRR